MAAKDRFRRNERMSEYTVRPDGQGFVVVGERQRGFPIGLVVGWRGLRAPARAP